MPTSDEVSFIDANILVYAAMEDAPQSLEQGVTQIYTYNRGDFAGFAELTVLTP